LLSKSKILSNISFFNSEQENFIPISGPYLDSVNLLKHTNYRKEVFRRRMLFRNYIEISGLFKISPLYRELPEGIAPYGYPFYLEQNSDNSIYEIYQEAASRGLKLYRWPNLPEEIEEFCPDHYRRLWVINFQD
jgi:hypothetical protein